MARIGKDEIRIMSRSNFERRIERAKAGFTGKRAGYTNSWHIRPAKILYRQGDKRDDGL